MYRLFTECHFAGNENLKLIGIVEMRRDRSGSRLFHQIGLRQALVAPQISQICCSRARRRTDVERGKKFIFLTSCVGVALDYNRSAIFLASFTSTTIGISTSRLHIARYDVTKILYTRRIQSAESTSHAALRHQRIMNTMLRKQCPVSAGMIILAI